ncbi:hypothetical protein KAW43_00160 [Candidatus Parcubacteria bacterium]|nr:hypothetical protein [Candidatus Parcubacteria bacterium]
MAAKARIVDVTASSSVKVVGSGTLIVESNEEFDLSENEIGLLEGKRSHHHKGIFMQGGVLNPGWKGRLTIEFLLSGEAKIEKGDKIAHAIIFTLDEAVKTTRNKKEKGEEENASLIK